MYVLGVERGLWFGDERGYNATGCKEILPFYMLWFGDERGYNATHNYVASSQFELWFGDERGYNATIMLSMVMKSSCGLVMKEDITQRVGSSRGFVMSCGLVMKEDITQRSVFHASQRFVVVW